MIDPTIEVTSSVSLSSRTTGACEIPCSCKRSMAGRTFWCAPMATSGGTSPCFAASTSSMRRASGFSWNPYWSIHASEYSFDR